MSTADFQPARLVARLQGILLPNTGRDGSVANFCLNSILSFSTESAESGPPSSVPEMTRLTDAVEKASTRSGHGIQRGGYPAVAPMGGAAADEVRLGM
jgi:hypothetical protein